MMNVAHASLVVVVAWLAADMSASAQPRSVVVNGQRLNGAQIAQLEQRACTPIPNGQYWLNLQTGEWGYAGNPRVRGVIGEACARQQPRKSLSERRQLYRPGEILSQ
jgi:hypothetical protein